MRFDHPTTVGKPADALLAALLVMPTTDPSDLIVGVRSVMRSHALHVFFSARLVNAHRTASIRKRLACDFDLEIVSAPSACVRLDRAA